MLKAGVAIRDITPQQKILMSGYPEPKERYALTAHDPLYSSAYYFDNGKEKMMFFCNDIINMTRDRCNELRMLVEKHCGIPRQNVAVSCTHTHSGPVSGSDIWKDFEAKGEMFPDNNDYIRDLMLEAAKEAVATAFDAEIGYGIGTCGKEKGMGGNRHNPDGLADPSVNVLGIKDKKGQLRGCIVNYSMHPTVLQAENFRISADFPCYIREYLNEDNPYLVFGFNMGSSGNQSTRYFRKAQDFDEARRIGYLLAEEAKKVLDGMTYTDDIVMKANSVPAMPPLKKIPSLKDATATAEKAQADLDKLNAEKAPYPVVRSAECTLIGANFLTEMAASVERVGDLESILSDQLPLEVMAFRLGDCVFSCVSCENFVEVSKEVKDNSPFKYTFMSSLTNGCTKGYVCADYAYDEFCYEAQASTFAKGAAKVLAEACLKAINSVK